MDADEELKRLEKQRRAESAAGVQVVERKSAEDAVAELDQRIEQRRGQNNDWEAKQHARSSGVGLKNPPPSTSLKSPPATSNLKSPPPSNGTPSRPGAFSVGQLDDLEANVVAKTRGSSTPNGGLDDLERDVVAKNRARPPSHLAATNDIRSEIAMLEARATGRSRAPVSDDGTGGIELSQLESDVLAKSAARRSMGTPNELSQLEGDVVAKNRARSSATQLNAGAHQEDGKDRASLSGVAVGVRSLDDRIAYKTGIPLESAPMDHSGTTKPDEADTKVAEAGGLVAEKMQLHHDAAAVENKLDGHPHGNGVGLLVQDVENGEAEGDNLAVAIAVKEDEEDAYIPAAEAYDPSAKPSLLQNRRFRLYSLLACSMIVVMIAVVAVLLTKNSGGDDVIETILPTLREGASGIEEQLELIVGEEVLKDATSSQYRALQWIIDEDPVQLTSESENLVQRFLLANFYFQLHEETDWLSCNAPTDDDSDDFCLFQKLTGVFPKTYSSVASYKWLSENHECYWAGLTCDEFFQLRSIDLLGQDIVGTLPSELVHFTFLQGINLGWNQFTGTIPPGWGDLPHLLNVEVYYNQLTGPIPTELSKAENLQMLNVADNLLTGIVPSEIGEMINLKGLFLYNNALSGTFPVEFANLSSLTYVRMQGNYLTGSLPTEMGEMAIREIWFHRLPLSGPIPSELGNMDSTLDLRLARSNINGTIPEEIYNLTSVWRLDLYETQISGTISSNMVQMTDLDRLRFRSMRLTGTIPTELASMSELGMIWFDGNDLVGAVPPGLCDWRVAINGITEITADCLDDSETGVPRVECSCCDLCCDHATGDCSAP
eukprot:Nitzschia sp. Nitz4//scaffold6_size259037//111449//114018//NITZ4_001070-RA/size259037-augustus-gene-0.320-mRNA-1//-1//CDS//3329556881//6837//frame0